MGGDSGSMNRETAMNLQMALGQQEYGLASTALGGGMGYLTAANAMGGGVPQGGKYGAMGTDVLETSGRSITAGGGPFGAGSVGAGLGAGAAGETATSAQQGSAALDEINKIRSDLAGQGLASTGLAGQAGQLQAEAFKMMPNRPQWPSVVGGVMGAGSAMYGAFNQPGGGTPNAPSPFTFGGDTAGYFSSTPQSFGQNLFPGASSSYFGGG